MISESTIEIDVKVIGMGAQFCAQGWRWREVYAYRTGAEIRRKK
jgi:hypothetical protein